MSTNGPNDSGDERETPTSGSGGSIVNDISENENTTVFRDKRLVDPYTIVDNDRIYGRYEQLAAEAWAFRDTLDGERPPDLLLYGPSGTGKSLTEGVIQRFTCLSFTTSIRSVQVGYSPWVLLFSPNTVKIRVTDTERVFSTLSVFVSHHHRSHHSSRRYVDASRPPAPSRRTPRATNQTIWVSPKMPPPISPSAGIAERMPAIPTTSPK